MIPVQNMSTVIKSIEGLRNIFNIKDVSMMILKIDNSNSQV